MARSGLPSRRVVVMRWGRLVSGPEVVKWSRLTVAPGVTRGAASRMALVPMDSIERCDWPGAAASRVAPPARHAPDPSQRRRLAHQVDLARLLDQPHLNQIRRNVAHRQITSLQPLSQGDRGRSVFEADTPHTTLQEEIGEGIGRILA